MDPLSNLMGDGGDPDPRRRKLDQSNPEDSSSATPPTSGGNKKLARHLREFSRKVRGDLVAELAKHTPDRARVEELFSIFTGYAHRGSVKEFWPLVDALWRFDSETILRGAVVMGGWHRPPPKALVALPTALPSTLEDVLGTLNFCVEALAIVETKPGPLWKKHLCTHKWLFPFAAGLDPGLRDDAEEKIRAVRRDINLKAEHVLCTMQNEALVFYPTPNHPRRGWEDFHTILSWYRLLDFSVQRDFEPYYFLFQPPA